MLRWLPDRLIRLYRRIADARPYARGTKPKPPPPEPIAVTGGGRERQFRLEIVQDAYSHRRPKPRRLFRAPQAPRDLTSWCDAPNAWTGRSRPRCPSCERARANYVAATHRKDWKAECWLYRQARQGAVKLLAERRKYRHERGIVLAVVREERKRQGPGVGAEHLDLYLHLGAGSPRGLGTPHVADRRAVEQALIRAHGRHLRRNEQKRRLWLRDRQLGGKTPVIVPSSIHEPDREPAPPAGATHPTPSRPAGSRRSRTDPSRRKRAADAPRPAASSDDAAAPGHLGQHHAYANQQASFSTATPATDATCPNDAAHTAMRTQTRVDAPNQADPDAVPASTPSPSGKTADLSPLPRTKSSDMRRITAINAR
jgi:hypothetical protein